MSEGRFARNSDFSIGNVSGNLVTRSFAAGNYVTLEAPLPGNAERARSSVWLEHRPFKPRVAGSNPVGPAYPGEGNTPPLRYTPPRRGYEGKHEGNNRGIDWREIPQYVDATNCGCVLNHVGPVYLWLSAALLRVTAGVEGYC